MINVQLIDKNKKKKIINRADRSTEDAMNKALSREESKGEEDFQHAYEKSLQDK
jgi:hypothetical protein